MTTPLHRLNQAEIPLCMFFNRINHQQAISRFFAVISRLGDGVFWYTLMGVIPCYYGQAGIAVSLHMGLVSLVALLLYKWLKQTTQRVRPYHYSGNILQNVAALDQFSFPSGHTLHAVSFSIILVYYYPAWALLVVPFTVLVGLSRLVLGLHYPSDVLIGALIGSSLAYSSLLLHVFL